MLAQAEQPSLAAQSATQPRWLIVLLAVSIALVLGITARYATLRNVNWDEFYYLSQVYDAVSQRPVKPLQTFHVRLFPWLAGSAETEIDEINFARKLLLGLHCLTCLCVWGIARHRLSTAASLFAVLTFAGFSYVVSHATSFRTDPLATFLLTFALYCLVQRRRGLDVLAGASLGLAFVLTIKVLMFAPCAVMVLMYQRVENRASWSDVLWRFSRVAVSMAATAALLLTVHIQLTDLGATTAATQAVSVSSHSSQKMFQPWPPVPRLDYLLISIQENRLTWCLILAATCVMFRCLFDRERRAMGWWLAATLWPAATLLFYRNAFPYFYVTIMPLAALAVAEVFNLLCLRWQRTPHAGLAMLLVVIPLVHVLGVVGCFAPRMVDQQVAQREHLRIMHAMFPDPVAYIDRNSTVARFPKVGFFMSTWGLENYRAANQPVMRDILMTHQPHFMVANVAALSIDQSELRSVTHPHLLLPEDFDTLTDHFIPFWGRIFVAGQTFENLGVQLDSFEVLIGGDYVLDATDELFLDGERMQPGEVRSLAPGVHTIHSVQGEQRDVILRIKTAIPAPSQPPAQQGFFFDLSV